MYDWRHMTAAQRQDVMCLRQLRGYPGHAPPHSTGPGTFHLSAANCDHRIILGRDAARLRAFCGAWMGVVESHTDAVHAWCVPPNHYHALVTVQDLEALTAALGRLHGRTSHDWNREDHSQGRQCWHRASDRRIRSERHFFATLNYIHHNPVHHRVVARWQDWPFSSATQFLAAVGRDEAIRIWQEFPVRDYGSTWDTWRLDE
jgi:putative transposase